MPAPGGPDPDHAWKVLALVNEWIRHADAKAGVTLAFTGALGTMLFNLVQQSNRSDLEFSVLVGIACIALLATAVCCGLTLVPRVDDADEVPEAINRLFYASITKNFKRDRVGYAAVLTTLTAVPGDLIEDIAHQIHANARIATVKNEYARRAIVSAFGAATLVAAVAFLVGIRATP